MLMQRILHSSMVFQHVIENMHDGVLTIDRLGIITTVNAAAINILEISKEQILDKKLSDGFFDYAENDDFIQIILDAVYDSSMNHHKICNYYTGQHLKSLFVTTSFLKAEIEGTLQSIGVTVLFSDITELQELRDAAAALDKIKLLNQKLERLSYFDELTGLPNRRFFNDTCNREWYRAMRLQRSLAFIMIDVDYFKELNDQHGHQTGDACLLAVANTLNSALKRPYDLIMRYGGDEFIAVIPDADIKAARIIAETMHRAILELNIENACTSCGRVTVSIGVSSQVPVLESHWKELLTAVDKAIYRAKQNGRNQIAE